MRYLNIFKSRTFWTIIVLFIINGVEGIKEFIPGGYLTLVDSVLGLLAIYFAKVSPRVVVEKK